MKFQLEKFVKDFANKPRSELLGLALDISTEHPEHNEFGGMHQSSSR